MLMPRTFKNSNIRLEYLDIAKGIGVLVSLGLGYFLKLGKWDRMMKNNC